MKTNIIASIIAIASMFSAIAQVAPEKPADTSIVGDWKVRTTAEVWAFSAPSTMTSSTGGKATWKKTEDSKYEVTWTATTAKVTISADGKSLSAVSPSGKSIDADRVVVPPDPIIGKWRHQKSQEWTFKADGTCSCTSGATATWKLLPSNTLERKYVMVWAWSQRPGRHQAAGVIGNCEMSRDGMTMKSKFERPPQEEFDLKRLDESSP